MSVIAMLTLIARSVLAGVFVIAAVAKLRDRSGTRRAVVEFGAPAGLAGLLAVALPIVELVVAGLLVPPETAFAGAVGSLALLVLFTAAIAVNLVRGRTPDCQCFGQLASAPVSGRTLVRNGILAAVALVAAIGSATQPPVGLRDLVGGRTGGDVAIVLALVGAVAALLLTSAFVSLLRSYGRVLTRLERVETALAAAGIPVDDGLEVPRDGLAPGSPVPFFAATAVGGEAISSETIAASTKPTLLLFSSMGCGACESLLPTVAEWQSEHRHRLDVVVASSGPEDDVAGEATRYGLERVLHDGNHRLADLFQANGTPSAVLMAADGTIASWVASGSEWIEQLVAYVVGSGDEGGLPVGTEAPALELPSLSGDDVHLASLRGRASVLLFWDPDCGYCRSMHSDLLKWEASANGVTPRLVIVSSGDADAVRAEGFRSLVLLDRNDAAGAAFEAGGTPMAVLVDADGRVASPVVAGADAVLALANTRVTA